MVGGEGNRPQAVGKFMKIAVPILIMGVIVSIAAILLINSRESEEDHYGMTLAGGVSSPRLRVKIPS